VVPSEYCLLATVVPSEYCLLATVVASEYCLLATAVPSECCLLNLKTKSDISKKHIFYMVMDFVPKGPLTSAKEMFGHCDVQNKNGSLEKWRSALKQ
jgi:hypothetical protein